MGRIVVGVDGSEHAKRALAWAAEEARLRGSTLHLVHSWKFPQPTTDPGDDLPHIDIEGAAREVIDQARSLVGDVAVEEEISGTLPGQALVEASEGADMVVVGARGLGSVKGLLLGSVSQQVAQHAPCPVVIIPADR